MLITTTVFLILNFLALGVGNLLMGQGPSSEWYLKLKTSPLTPVGWVFGVAWSVIMICFSLYMTELWTQAENQRLLVIFYTSQWILNVIWSLVFFRFQRVFEGLVIATLLTILVGFLLVYYLPTLGLMSICILPYVVWMGVAVYLNGYILLNN